MGLLSKIKEELIITATAVPGKKNMVKTAIVFIDELSLMLASASFLESRAMDRLMSLSWCCIKL